VERAYAGNPDKGDDGAGPLCAARLQARLPAATSGRVLVIDGRETSESQTGVIRRFGPELTIIIDDAVGGYPPGAVFVVKREKIADEGVSTHTISLVYPVRYLEESLGSRVIVPGIEPEDMSQGAPISPAVNRAEGEITDFLFKQLAV